MKTLALTDHDGLTGAVEFYDACVEANVRPILGLELFVTSSLGSGNLVFLATSLKGWRSLCCLSTALQTAPHRDLSRGITLEQLAENTQDLICLTGGVRGAAHQLIEHDQKDAAIKYLRTLADLFPKHLYVELQQHSQHDTATVYELNTLARGRALPVVATHSVYYLKPEQADLQRTLSSIRLLKPRDKVRASELAPEYACFLREDEMRHKFAGYPQALTATEEIAERCQLQLPLGKPHYPALQFDSGVTAEVALRQQARAGATKLYGEITLDLESRLDHELTVIGERGYAPLFLIVEEILNYARTTGVPYSSRGSAASSLVAHCLGITSPDPVRHNLYFERFLNPARATPPDIDTDLCSRRRGKVIEHVYEQYGHDRVAMVCTINRFRARSALREVAKAYGLPSDTVKQLADSLPHRWWGPPGKYDVKEPFAELSERYRDPLHQNVFKDSKAILGLPHHLSIHPGGVVITPGPMLDFLPTHLASKGLVITQFDLDSVERLGLVKIDLLGIRGLTVMGDVAESISGGGPLLQALDSIPDQDADTSDAVRHGRTIGCFQIESPGMRATLKEIDAQSMDDILTALALYRPGPLTGGLKDAFVRRHLKQEPVHHLHPALAPLLDDTYGVILYQEQVLRIAHGLAGLSLADADLLRRAMSHFDPGKQMQTLKLNFIAGAETKSGVPREIAERVWELMAAFAGYGFPKAHAASYAQVAWRSAWCKVHMPAEFMAAVLANWGGYYSQRVYLTEARRMGLTIRPPHINYARHEFCVDRHDGQPVLYMGLDQVKDLTRRTQAHILNERPFSSLHDFLSRVDPRPDEATNLIKAGALEGLGSIPALLDQLKQGKWERGQMALFDMVPELGDDWPLAQRVAAQEEILGTGVDAHPLELVADRIAAANALTTVGAAARVGKRVRVAGMRQTWRRTSTARGDYIYFMALEDLEGVLDVVIMGEVYRRNRNELSGPGPYVIEGVLEMDSVNEEPTIRAEKIWKV